MGRRPLPIRNSEVEMIKVFTDESLIIREAKQHDPKLAKAVSQYLIRNTLWHWIEKGMHHAALLTFKVRVLER